MKDGKAANGSNVHQYAPNSYRSQKWVAVRSGSVYKLVSALSSSMALDVKDGKAANGSNVQIYTANGYRFQQWTFKNGRPAVEVRRRSGTVPRPRSRACACSGECTAVRTRPAASR
ncbi:RICIN domain-containing protein [Bifidobacterium adolescentis]|uniref:Ricin B lectin domain-containing protein n=1 Tax=Bifidobacterium adolescentis L2-32 TaxID=411481 RepID=A7A6Q3_BIFAD|nr:RICIN domain-containing protein [Bifidobacterium adolescentis]EDN82718.1 hypothetical protein BIFADO_01536 [Bifidobacterium adolescentis L2-32]